MIFSGQGHWDLQRDEYLYLADGRHLSLGYMEIPPLTALFARICILFGNSYLIIRLIPAIFGAVTLGMTGLIARELGGGLFAEGLSCLGFLVSGYLRMNLLFQPNSFEVLCFTAGIYCLIRYIQSGKETWVLWIGVIVGFGMLNKYSMFLFVLGVPAGLALTKYRFLFTKRVFFLAIGIAFLIFFPNILWQAFRQFPVVFHMRVLEKNQLQYIDHTSFLFAQLIDCFPATLIWVAGLLYLFWDPKGREFILLGWTWLTVILILFVLHGKGYYSMAAYPMIFSAGGVFWEKISRSTIKKWVIRPALILLSLGLCWNLFPVLLPIYDPTSMVAHMTKFANLGILKWEDGKNHALPQDYADMLGWKEMTRKVSKIYHRLPDTVRKNTIIFCDNYGEAGAIDYYGPAFGLPEAYSDNASFLYWIKPNLVLHNLLLVTDDTREMYHPFVREFAHAYLMDSIKNPLAREHGSLIIFFQDASTRMVKGFQDKIRQDRIRDHW